MGYTPISATDPAILYMQPSIEKERLPKERRGKRKKEKKGGEGGVGLNLRSLLFPPVL